MKIRWIIGVALLVLAAILIADCNRKPTTPTSDKDGPANSSANYIGSTTCQSCHQQEHALWQTSHHYRAMLPAHDTTVAGNFDNTELRADGVTSRFYRRDGKFFIHTEGEDGAYHEFEVKYVFGYEPLQQYLVELPGGRMQATRASWDTRSKKWFHQYAGQKLPAGSWLHWTGNGQNWNTMCASCHSTNLQKGYNAQNDTYHTTWSEINVSCESCHGAGSQHVEYINSAAFKAGNKQPGAMLALAKGSGQMTELNTCGYCHARRTEISAKVPVGHEVLQDYMPERPTTDYFHADGQMLDEDYNYTSFLQSKMFRRGVQCTNCHNPHSGQLKLNGSLVCGQCHAPEQYTSPQHTMHPNALAEVNCISCHMPSRVYMGNDTRHDHSFRVPRPDLSALHGTPNTCNSCHTQKTPEWAAQAIAKHYGPSRAYHFAEDLVPASRLDDSSLTHIRKLLTDTAVPNIVRAAGASYAGRLQSPAAMQQLVPLLADSSALVRLAATQALRNFPVGQWLAKAWPLLQDEVAAIRLAAADLLIGLPADQVPADAQASLGQAGQLLQQFLFGQADFAQGSLVLGDYFYRRGDAQQAIHYYRRAVAKDSLLLNARVNLATVLSAQGQNEAALQQLDIAAKADPQNDHIQYTLGLLQAEMSNTAAASRALQKATAINPRNLRAWYNYGLLAQQNGQKAEALHAYQQALAVDPTSGEVLNAIVIFYLQQNQAQAAMPYAQRLKQYHGQNPQYQPLLQQLGL